jgi:hypothetical protein
MKFPKSEDEVRDHWAYHKIVKYMKDNGMSNGYLVRVNLNDVFDEMARQEKFNLPIHALCKFFWLPNTDKIRVWTATGGPDASWTQLPGLQNVPESHRRCRFLIRTSLRQLHQPTLR